jgi:CheY-like chemotaxis protein
VRERIKREPRLRAVPLIMCSADQRALEQRADELAAAGDTVLPKPFALNDLLALLARVLAGDAGAR